MIKRKEWQRWIVNYGVYKLSKDLNCHRQTVMRWVRHGDLPSDRLKKEIVILSGGALTFNSFYV